MITLVSGTNRGGSNTFKVAKAYSELLSRLGTGHQLLSLEDLPRDFAFTYMAASQSADTQAMIEKYVRNAGRFIVVVPEYNGTFPGIFKLFLDALHPRDLAGKKLALVGVSSGRGGNIRGLDQLTNAFHYLGVNIYPFQVPVSRIRDLVDPEGNLVDTATLAVLEKQAKGFLAF
jgi:chromate reductase, NAD(P)H dehydrogenase (quinone)